MAETCKRHPSLTTRDWPGLPSDLLESIFARLENDLKYGLSFSGVCRQWRCIVAEKGRNVVPSIMLMPHDEKDDISCNMGNIFSLASLNNSYKLRLQKLQGRRCCGSVNGLLITVDKTSGRLHLFNPVLGKQIYVHSPSVRFLEKQDGCITKVDMFGNLNVKEDYVIVVYRLSSKVLHFCRWGRKKWNPISITYGGVQNIGYHKGKLYVISVSGTIEVFELQKSATQLGKCIIKVRRPAFDGQLETLKKMFDEVKHLDVPKKDKNGLWSHMVCLAETPARELLMIIRLVETYKDKPYYYNTKRFMVFKLVENGGDWTEVDNLGDWVLFVGMKSICLRACDVPGCEANSIYFSALKDETNWHDMGVFSMDDRSVKPLYENCPFKLSPTFWFTPNLQLLK